MASPILEMKDALVGISFVAAPAAGTAPTFPTASSYLCIATSLEISTEISKNETKVGCGSTIRTYTNHTGTITIRGIVPYSVTGSGWSFQTSIAGTPEGMAIRVSIATKASLTPNVYEGIILNWRGSLNSDSPDVEEITVDLVTSWV